MASPSSQPVELTDNLPVGEGAVVNLNEKGSDLGVSLWRLAMRRIRRDYLTLGALLVLTILTVLSFSAPLISDTLDVSYRQTSAERKFLPLFLITMCWAPTTWAATTWRACSTPGRFPSGSRWRRAFRPRSSG
ncbi:MAG: hypothetical protein HC915_21615 [Anaerolineae bacterium]|nr:hypothetical protein [Anaerolineae bacterium]